MDNLSLVSTDDLLSELRKRHDGVAFAGLKKDIEGKNGMTGIQWFVPGDPLKGIALGFYLALQCYNRFVAYKLPDGSEPIGKEF